MDSCGTDSQGRPTQVGIARQGAKCAKMSAGGRSPIIPSGKPTGTASRRSHLAVGKSIVEILEALGCFVTQLEADGRSAHTIEQYQRHVALLGRWLKDQGLPTDVAAITHEVLARFLASPTTRQLANGMPKKATTQNALRTSVRCFFDYAWGAGWVGQNAARLVRRARCGAPLPRGLPEKDQALLIRALETARGPEAERDYMLFHLLLATGVRLSAALALREQDVDLGQSELTLWKSKGGRVERVVLGQGIREHLARYLAGKAGGRLFAGPSGAPMTRRHAGRRLSIWLERAGCRQACSPHGLRHAFAQGLYQRTGDVLLVQAALGHRSILSTVVYAKIGEERLRAIVGSI